MLLETLEAYLAAGGRKAEAARALHLERQSLYLRLHRIEEALGVSLDDEDVVLGLHLAVRARRFRRGALDRRASPNAGAGGSSEVRGPTRMKPRGQPSPRVTVRG